MARWLYVLFWALTAGVMAGLGDSRPVRAAERQSITVPSSVDGADQQCYLHLPSDYARDQRARPLLVSLHSWSGDVSQRNEPLEVLADARGWLLLYPDFRGANRRPEACGSALAQQDILDAVAWVRAHQRVNARRIYLTGASGGGHMTMLMAGRHPQVWAAASAWVGISDLPAWHELHRDGNYGRMMRAACGGAPGDAPAVDRQYRDRSPLTHLHQAVQVPLEIAAGIHDGHQGSVPVRHSLWAFNVIARAAGAVAITDAEIEQLSRVHGRLETPQPEDQVDDASFGRAIYLRRTAGPVRVTIFEGGHEGLAAAAVAWLEQHEQQGP